MVLLGYHASIKDGIYNSIKRAARYSCESFQIFLSSPRTWSLIKLDDESVKQFKLHRLKYNFPKVVVHSSYLPNLSSNDPEIMAKTRFKLNNEIMIADNLGLNYYVMHVGSHKGKGIDEGINNTISTLNFLLESNPSVDLLLETSAGTKNSVGSHFDELATIIDAVDDKSIGVCFDTAHVFASGYDLTNINSIDAVFTEFDNIIGLNRLKVFHLNDSKYALGSGKDRHEHIGMGYIGLPVFEYIMNINAQIPAIIETPVNDYGDNISNLNLLRELRYSMSKA